MIQYLKIKLPKVTQSSLGCFRNFFVFVVYLIFKTQDTKSTSSTEHFSGETGICHLVVEGKHADPSPTSGAHDSEHRCLRHATGDGHHEYGTRADRVTCDVPGLRRQSHVHFSGIS